MELQVEARNMGIRTSWQNKIEQEKERLIRHHPGMVHHLRVSFERTSHHKEGGYVLRLVATVPNDTLVVKRKGEDGGPLLVEAFDVLGMQLKEMQRRKKAQKRVKIQEYDFSKSNTATVKHVYPFESYGFLATLDGREIYFHENALKDLALDNLNEGDEVRFSESQGDKGPCASWIRAVK